MFTKENIVYVSDVDGLEISVLEVRPEEAPRAVVQLVHGMCEHKERYLPFMEYLAGRGYASVIFDQRGHGASAKSKEDLGYMYRCGIKGYLKDIIGINEMIHERFPGIPLILFGHSMGSLAVRAFASDHDDCIDMLIVCGSPSDTGAKELGRFIAFTEGKLRGFKHKSKLLEAMSFGGYAKKFADEKSIFAWLSTDPEIVKYYEQSDYCGFTFTDDGYLLLFNLMRKAYNIKNWHCTNPDLPVLLISGSEDPCMGSKAKFAAAVHAMKNAGYKDVSAKLYKGMRHEILNEKDKELVYSDIAKYIRKKLK